MQTHRIAVCALLVCAASRLATADTLYIGETDKKPIAAAGVKVIDLQGNNLIYQTPGGEQLKKPLSQMQQILIDGETDFDSAEKAFAGGDWAAAVTGYQSAMSSASKQWIKDRSAMRLAQAAAKAGRFDAAVAAYAAVLQRNPDAAATVKPELPADGSPQLKAAADAIATALNAASLTDAQRGSLLGLQLQIERADHDTSAVDATLQQMMRMGNLSPADTAIVKLVSARAAIDAKDFAKAQSEIETNKADFTDPAAQVDALFILAQAREGQLSADASANDLKDVAIDNMKVVAFGKDLAGQPHVADALVHTAQLEEKLKEPKVALQLYQQVSREYADAPAAATAKVVDRSAQSLIRLSFR